HHLLMAADGTIKLDRGAPVCHQRPSGTLLLRSMAEALDAGAMGIILTGMGDDGAEGLAAIRRGGGYTITEDESTAVVYGMPAVAVEIGASMERLPLPAIAPRMRAITQLAEVRS
ncbi:MAG TPA: CheB methylesterase domain-containing protein, partial [Phycisphaerales bacterium]|nr:CheB methylesterase domain-containing protein [Phycisphaerales bacterium]